MLSTSEERRERYCNEKQLYQPAVRIGNWNEDLFREEAKIAELLEKHAKKQLKIQRVNRFLDVIYEPSKLTTNADGYLHDGDAVMLRWSGGDRKFLAAWPFEVTDGGAYPEPCDVTGTEDSRICARSVFFVFRENTRIPETIPLTYGEAILIRTNKSVGNLMLHSDHKSALKQTRWSNHQEVKLVKDPSGRVLWRVLDKNPKCRLALEGQYIPVNTDVVISHVYTNHRLALEINYPIKSSLGMEWEISCHTYKNSMKLEQSDNYWQFSAPRIKAEDYDTTLPLRGQETVDPRNAENCEMLLNS